MPFHTICIQYGLIFFNLPNEKILFWGYLVSVIWLYPQLGFPGGSAGKESACNAGDLGSILDQEDPLEKGMATYSGILAWRIPWTEEPMGLQRVRHNLATNTLT